MILDKKDWEKSSKNLEAISISASLLIEISKQIWTGNSLERSLMNFALREVKIYGKVIDLGSGTSSPSYSKYLDMKEVGDITVTDYFRGGRDVVRLDLEKPFPKLWKNFDFVLCINTLEHIYSFKNVIRESKKLLKKEGGFVGSTPFLYNLHPSPNDYYRFSHQALVKVFSDEGFKLKKMVYLGFGPFTASFSQWFFMIPRIFRIPLSITGILVDVVIMKYSEYFRLKHPLGYMFVFQNS